MKLQSVAMLPINNSDTAWLIVSDYNQDNNLPYEELKEDVLNCNVNDWTYEYDKNDTAVVGNSFGMGSVGGFGSAKVNSERSTGVGDEIPRNVGSGFTSEFTSELVGGNWHNAKPNTIMNPLNDPYLAANIKAAKFHSIVYQYAKELYKESQLENFAFQYEQIDFNAKFIIFEDKEFFAIYDETDEHVCGAMSRFTNEPKNCRFPDLQNDWNTNDSNK